MLRLRQLVLVARDLRPVELDLCDTFDLEVCFRDPGVSHFGLRHGLYPIGDRLLEVVSPMRADTAAGRYLDRRGGDGGYMVIVQVDDPAPFRRRADTLGVRVVHEARAAGTVGAHLHPGDMGGAILSIDRSDPPQSWGWAGPDWAYHTASSVVTDMIGAELRAADPDAMAQRWASLLDRPVTRDLTISLDDASLRFVADPDGQGEGLSGIDLVATDRGRAGDSIVIGGVRFQLY